MVVFRRLASRGQQRTLCHFWNFPDNNLNVSCVASGGWEQGETTGSGGTNCGWPDYEGPAIASDGGQAIADARFVAHLWMVNEISGSEGRQGLAALRHSVHSGGDYGAYQATPNAIFRLPVVTVRGVTG